MDEEFQILRALQLRKMRQVPQRHGLLNSVWVNLIGIRRIRPSNLSQSPEPEISAWTSQQDKRNPGL